MDNFTFWRNCRRFGGFSRWGSCARFARHKRDLSLAELLWWRRSFPKAATAAADVAAAVVAAGGVSYGDGAKLGSGVGQATEGDVTTMRGAATTAEVLPEQPTIVEEVVAPAVQERAQQVIQPHIQVETIVRDVP